MAKQQVTVPDIGGAEGAEVIEILVAVGDRIELEQGLIVLESDKASMEIPSTAAGVVAELLVAEGDLLSEGSPLVVIEISADAATDEPVSAEASDPGDEPPPVAATSSREPEPAEAAGAPPAPAPAAAETTVPVPDIGSEEPVELIEICVQEGAQVAEGDSLVVLESDKASMEVPAPFAGEVVRLLVKEGTSISQGEDLLVMRPDAASPAADVSRPATSSAPAPAPATAPAPSAAASADVGSAPAVTASAPARNSDATDGGKGVYAGPAVRKLAREFGVPLQRVTGSGPRGRVLKEDLHRFVQDTMSGKTAAVSGGAGIPAIPEVDFSKFGDIDVTERSKLDKLTAANMQRSWLNVPHVTQFEEADITELEAFRTSLKGDAEQRGTRLTPMPFLLKACAVALRANPKINSSLAEGGEKLVFKQYCHIGMAVDTPAGLVVPVIRDVDKKTIWELAEEVLELAGKARDRKLMPAEMQGGCFTISSLGGIGGTGFTPIVNAPEVAILGVSRAGMKPVWDGAEFVARKMLPLSLSYDHRVVNGGDAGRFLTQYAGLLADIRRLVM